MRGAVVQSGVVADLGEIGKYRARVVRNLTDGRYCLDIREWVDEPRYTGFTRRGIRVELDEYGAGLEAVVHLAREEVSRAKDAETS